MEDSGRPLVTERLAAYWALLTEKLRRVEAHLRNRGFVLRSNRGAGLKGRSGGSAATPEPPL
ncbi:MAG: hypothetical protein OEM40_09235 [Acidimicrobiia bacterium]|nr:hypothetical protein [Acidimicrobiia bacterium]